MAVGCAGSESVTLNGLYVGYLDNTREQLRVWARLCRREGICGCILHLVLHEDSAAATAAMADVLGTKILPYSRKGARRVRRSAMYGGRGRGKKTGRGLDLSGTARRGSRFERNGSTEEVTAWKALN